jgi:3-phosphoshikimate 1-carboxyvinyltransferase
VPGDFSAAAFFLAAAAATPGATVTAEGVSLNPTRTGLLDALARMGAAVECRPRSGAGEEPEGDVTVTGPERLRGVELPAEWVPRMIDEIPAWTIAASAAEGTSRVRGAAELRVKESDRLRMLADCLGGAGFGLAVEESPDGLAVTGGTIRSAWVRADDDHRIAMAMALIGTRAGGPVTIDGAGGIATSFPDFAATLGALGGQMEEHAMAGGR